MTDILRNIESMKDLRNKSGWLSMIVVFDNSVEKAEMRFEVFAKVYDEPSDYGINNGRVSKLEIRTVDGDFAYNYDRGLDFCSLRQPIVDQIVERLELLPPTE